MYFQAVRSKIAGEIGRKIRIERAKREGMKQADLAFEVGVSTGYISLHSDVVTRGAAIRQ